MMKWSCARLPDAHATAGLSRYFWLSRWRRAEGVLASRRKCAGGLRGDVRQDYWLAWRGETSLGGICAILPLPTSVCIEACQR